MDISKERENKKIAIIIPAFKPDFLQQTLESISSQTCKNFRVYIGDDNSPHNLQRIVSPYINQLDIIYHKFEDNMGKQDLTSHWDRCIKLSHEPIIWLFSDDDIMPKDGIVRIMEALAIYGENKILFRFPLNVIDENNNISNQ
jgi:glycosyltransferase involved in cell wall biosynthesis